MVLFGIGTFRCVYAAQQLTTMSSIELILNGGNLTLLALVRSHQDIKWALALFVTAVGGGRQRSGLRIIVVGVFRNRHNTNIELNLLRY